MLTHGHIIMFLPVTRCVLLTATQLWGHVARLERADERWATVRQERNCRSQSYQGAGKSRGPIRFL